MDENEITLAEERLNRYANLALYHQGVWLFLLALLILVHPSYVKEAGQVLGMLALGASFIASKIYIHAGKKVEEFKKFSPKETEKRKKEYMFRFFSPYILWTISVIIFSS